MRPKFYLPSHWLPSAEALEDWKNGAPAVLAPGGKTAAAQAWICQTWARLRRDGCEVELVTELPTDGIIITMSACLAAGRPLPREVFVAGLVADGLPHPRAHVHLVQNALHATRLRDALFMPHWPQPNLLPRDGARGDTFRRVCYFGDESNLAPELRAPAWREALSQTTGAELEIRGAALWHDYRDVDAVIAVRDFAGGRQLHKPGTKLYNAWLASVPFIGGMDSAYAADGRPGTDYLVARSAAEALDHLQAIARDAVLRNNLVQAGNERARHFSPEAMLQKWRHLLEVELPERAARRLHRPRALRWWDDRARTLACRADRLLRS